ncbi:hypothetical protein CGI91_14470 [Vibrio parahaemolyticus]|nr:hypothetical protein CGI91_14470 [Vibrio parahaemolyticus]
MMLSSICLFQWECVCSRAVENSLGVVDEVINWLYLTFSFNKFELVYFNVFAQMLICNLLGVRLANLAILTTTKS